ncbi:PEP-CTERM sorting domain-containing protein [Iodobacter sp. LRB]|uniref:PEP-CTERM sorting domain-containing protein n=1 Tax=unclassified Iodobacter TaxID=235634 RepID=UPI000C0D096A|nr:PEP-CTERM sorting domain-containing protein [Iodobacter sp. BJB302]PHV00698.1 hypothetical protein CSQ88_16070 [Iodobacter sp. BJB302]
MNIRKNTAAIVILLSLFSSAHAVNAYVDQFISFKDALGNNAVAYGNNGTLTAPPPEVVNPNIILGVPTVSQWVSIPTDYSAVYGFNGQKATDGLDIYYVDAGALSNVSIWGKLNITDAWTKIGSVTEGAPLGTTYNPVSSFLSLAGTGLSGVSQVMIRGTDVAGWSPGFDLMGIQGRGMLAAPVPEPETYALMGLGLIALLLNRRRQVDA